MIIVEGPDLVGKTTLCKTLADTNLQYIHFTRLADDFHRYYSYLPFIKTKFVLDRFHMSEIAYVAGRGEEQTTTNQFWYNALDRNILSIGGVIVVITADEELIVKRWRKGEMYDINTVLRANEAFMKIAQYEFPDFTPHVTMHIHCTLEHPFVSKDEVEFIKKVHELTVTRHSFLKAHNVFPTPGIET